MIIDGKKLAKKLNKNSRQRITQLRKQGIVPGIAVILVGNDPASEIYTRNKHRLARKLGINSTMYRFPDNVDQKTIINKIKELNLDNQVDGILVQKPLPSQLDGEQIINEINPEKDIDGLHPLNLGRLFAGQTGNYPIACTPQGIMTILDQYKVTLSGANVVIVGRSLLVGKPLLALLNNRNATVTFVGRHTHDFFEVTNKADILIVAAGVPGLITANNIKVGSVVIDVGINRLKSGKLTGDVDFNGVAAKASLITPVPGGVGPMTIATLMSQSVDLAYWHHIAKSKKLLA